MIPVLLKNQHEISPTKAGVYHAGSGRHFAKYWGGGGCEIFNIYAFGVHLRYANLSNIMLGISNSLLNYCNVTITLFAYILVCFLVPLAPKQRKL